MSEPDQARDHQPVEPTQVLPPGSFGRAAPADPPLFSNAYQGSAPPASGPAAGESTPPNSPLPVAADYPPDPEVTQVHPLVDIAKPAPPVAAPSWSGEATTAFPPTQPPPYAPAEAPPAYPGYQGYQGGVPGAAPAPPVAPLTRGSRAGVGALSALIGFVMVVAGIFLFTKFGFQVDRSLRGAFETPSVGNTIAAGLGVALLFGAALLNSWSGWATLLPGLALSALGGWLFFANNAWDQTVSSLQWALDSQAVVWVGQNGLLLVLGLVLLGASIAAFMSRGSGRREAG